MCFVAYRSKNQVEEQRTLIRQLELKLEDALTEIETLKIGNEQMEMMRDRLFELERELSDRERELDDLYQGAERPYGQLNLREDPNIDGEKLSSFLEVQIVNEKRH